MTSVAQRQDRHQRVLTACEADPTYRRLQQKLDRLTNRQPVKPVIAWEKILDRSALALTRRQQQRANQEITRLLREFNAQWAKLFARMELHVARNLQAEKALGLQRLEIQKTKLQIALRRRTIQRILLARDVARIIDEGNLSEAQRRAASLRRKAELIERKTALRNRPLKPEVMEIL